MCIHIPIYLHTYIIAYKFTIQLNGFCLDERTSVSPACLSQKSPVFFIEAMKGITENQSPFLKEIYL